MKTNICKFTTKVKKLSNLWIILTIGNKVSYFYGKISEM